MTTWCPKGCKPYGDVVAVNRIPFVVVSGQPAPYDKAGTVKASRQIRVDKEWWASRTERERHATLAHEHFHTLGNECEDCADRHAGYLMASWGYTPTACAAGFGFVRAAERFGAGERAAEGARAFSTQSVDGAGVDVAASRAASRLSAVSSAARGSSTQAAPTSSNAGKPTTRAVPLPVAVPPAETATRVTITDPSFTPATGVDPSTPSPAPPAPAPSSVGVAASALLVAALVFVVIVWGKV